LHALVSLSLRRIQPANAFVIPFSTHFESQF
jgi:hypothetical protein